MKTLTCYCGAQSGNHPAYIEAAEQLGAFVATLGCRLKFGASNNGLMGAFCRGFIGDPATSTTRALIDGYVPEKFLKVNDPDALGIRYQITATLLERKSLLLENSDLLLVLPGGTGTLDEVFDAMERDYRPADRDPSFKDVNIRPIYIFNQNGYYDHLRLQIEHMVNEGFVKPEKLKNFRFFSDHEALQDALRAFFSQP